MTTQPKTFSGAVVGHGLLRKHMTADRIPKCQCGLVAPKDRWSPVFLRDWHREHKYAVLAQQPEQEGR